MKKTGFLFLLTVIKQVNYKKTKQKSVNTDQQTVWQQLNHQKYVNKHIHTCAHVYIIVESREPSSSI